LKQVHNQLYIIFSICHKRERERERGTCTAFKGTSPDDTAATTLITRAATLTVSWNWINF
jgi:hypothetical protein